MIKKILLMYLLIFLSIFTKEILKKDIKNIYISPYSFSVTVKRMEDELKKMEIFLNDLVEKVVIKDSSELYKRRNFNDFSFLNNEQGRLNEENSNNVSCFYNRHFYI